MGAYLSAPITEKEMFNGEGVHVRYGGSAMQGWRRTMEDAHISQASVEGFPDVSIFAVFDGHGGSEVARFCQKHMVTELLKMKEFQDGSLDVALVDVFHRMDSMLRGGSFHEELEQMKTKEPADEDETMEEGESVSPMDALDLIKRVFQLKRIMGENANNEGSGSKPMEANPAPEDGLVQAGCTAVVAVKKGNNLYVANAGDSRGVLSRSGRAVALSEDHKPASDIERQRIIAAGGFLSEIGGVCRVNGNLNLSRAIGDLKYKCNAELPAKEQIITAQPDIRTIALTPEDDFFVLACDGVWDVMTNQDVVDFVGSRIGSTTPAEIASEVLDHCLAKDPKEARGIGCDNMTCLVIQLKHTQ